MYQSFWEGKEVLQIDGSYRLPYDFSTLMITPEASPSDTIWTAEIREAIYAFHDLAKNAIYTDKFIIIG